MVINSTVILQAKHVIAVLHQWIAEQTCFYGPLFWHSDRVLCLQYHCVVDNQIQQLSQGSYFLLHSQETLLVTFLLIGLASGASDRHGLAL